MSLLLEFVSCVVKNLPPLSEDVMDGWVKNPKALQNALKVLCPPEAVQGVARSQLAAWEKLYKKHFGINLDVSSIKIPERKDGFGRLILVAQGLTLNQVYNVLAKSFPCWRYIDDLDAAITKNDRDPKNGAYAIWVRDRQEADEELKNLSANQLAEQKHSGITLLERMLYELLYWNETGNHLDVANWTLCSGSRNSNGNVPYVYFDGSEVRVYWYYPDFAFDYLRSRSAVS